MIKKLFFVLMTAGTLVAVSCSDTKDKKTGKEEKIEKADDKTVKDDDVDDSTGDIKKASVELCDCFNKYMTGIDPTMEKILIKAANSDNPINTMQTEFMKIENEAERNRISQSFEGMDKNKEMEACGDKIKAKYNLKEKDKATEKQILMALEENNDCPLLAAMGKMALKMEARVRTNEKEDTNNKE